MKILLVMDQFNNGNNGTTISARRFADNLRKIGHEVRSLSIGETNENNFGLKQRNFGEKINKIISSQGMALAKPNKTIIEKALNWCDIVHFYMPFKLSKTTMQKARKIKKPMTAAFHVQPENISYNIGLGKSKLVNNIIYSNFKNNFYKYFNHIHCPSKFIADELKKHGYKAKLHIISNGVDENFKINKIEKPEEFKDKIIIIMVGRFSPEKRQEVLINSINNSKNADKIQLIFCGKGPKEQEYKELSKKLKNKPVFKFCTKEELIQTLDYSDLYVHTADIEIEAISCLEAIATGLVPIIANSPKSATSQFALDDRSLFNPGDTIDLANKIDYWIEHQEEKKKMEEKYANMVNEKYRISSSIKQIEEMFNEEIQSKDNYEL